MLVSFGIAVLSSLVWIGNVTAKEQKDRCDLSFRMATTAQDTIIILTASSGACRLTIDVAERD